MKVYLKKKKKQLPDLFKKYIERNKKPNGKFYPTEDLEPLIVKEVLKIIDNDNYKIEVLSPPDYSKVITLDKKNKIFNNISKENPLGDFSDMLENHDEDNDDFSDLWVESDNNYWYKANEHLYKVLKKDEDEDDEINREKRRKEK